MSLQEPSDKQTPASQPGNQLPTQPGVVEINGVFYREYLKINYTWSSNRGQEHKVRSNLVKHPWITGMNIYCHSHKQLDEHLQGIDLHLEMVSYYTCGPCGLYADLRGTVATVPFRARAVLTGTVRRREFIKPIVLCGFIITIRYDIWSLNVLVQKEVEEVLP
jgi:hypothetical protein